METPPSTFASELLDALAAHEAEEAPAPPARRPRSRRAQPRSFPVTVTRMPTVRCEVCGDVVPHLKGQLTAVLTAHYEREHADLLGR